MGREFWYRGEGNASVYTRPVARADCPPAPGTADGNRVQCLLYRVSFFKHRPTVRVLLVYPLQSRRPSRLLLRGHSVLSVLLLTAR